MNHFGLTMYATQYSVIIRHIFCGQGYNYNFGCHSYSFIVVFPLTTTISGVRTRKSTLHNVIHIEQESHSFIAATASFWAATNTVRNYLFNAINFYTRVQNTSVFKMIDSVSFVFIWPYLSPLHAETKAMWRSFEYFIQYFFHCLFFFTFIIIQSVSNELSDSA